MPDFQIVPGKGSDFKVVPIGDGISITKEWTVESLFGKKKEIKVHAEQVEMPKEYGGLSATAKLTIQVNGEIVHEANVPWAMPKADIALAMQVYMLAKQPSYAHPEWQSIMEQFAFRCEGFEPPTEVRWSKESLLD